jgi:hypothetical protein
VVARVGGSGAGGVTVRYYVDADTLGLAHSMVLLRGDVTYPGDPGGTFHGVTRPACVITATKTPDDQWIPVVAQQAWAVITRDRSILRRPHEVNLVRTHGAKFFTIASDERMTNWHLLEVLMCNWRRIDALAEQPGPYVWNVTRTAMRQLL